MSCAAAPEATAEDIATKVLTDMGAKDDQARARLLARRQEGPCGHPQCEALATVVVRAAGRA